MRSHYKKLGEFIQPVNVRNIDLKVERLLGVSVQKEFIPSIANTVGTDFKKYKVVRKNQFTYIADTSRRGDKIGLALLEDYDAALVSQAYSVFEIIDQEQLIPDYLMMWFRRPEFDRYARYHSHGSVREIFDWDAMCEVELPIPAISTQREIVAEYNTVVNRIKLNEQLNQKLEETAQAVYRRWFVEFEFPNEEGEPYKSSGGKMVWNEELGKEVPEGWESKTVKEFTSDMKSGGTPNRSTNEYWSSNDYPWIKTGELKNSVVLESEEYISELGLRESSTKLLPVNSVLVAMYGQGDTKGQVGYLKMEATTNQACCAMISSNEFRSTYLYYYFRVNRDEIVSVAVGGAQPNLSKEIIENLILIDPKKEVMEVHPLKEIMNNREAVLREMKYLKRLKDLLLSKMTKVEHEQNELAQNI